MALLLVLLVLLFAVIAPGAAFLAGLRMGNDRRRVEADAAERRELLDRMERAEPSGQRELLTELSRLYRDVSTHRGLPPR